MKNLKILLVILFIHTMSFAGQLSPEKLEEIRKELGIKPGDTITAVNGIKLNSMENVDRILKLLKSPKERLTK